MPIGGRTSMPPALRRSRCALRVRIDEVDRAVARVEAVDDERQQERRRPRPDRREHADVAMVAKLLACQSHGAAGTWAMGDLAWRALLERTLPATRYDGLT